MGENASTALPALANALYDDDRRVRRVAALSLGQLGQYTDGVENGLAEVLKDEDRYNRFHAGMALRRIDHPRTREVLFNSLFTARWCPMTNAENIY